MSVKLKVMSMNLRVAVEVDGINYFPNRTGRILETIEQESPDIIGFQEANDDMRRWLRSALKDYTVVGCGRLGDYRGEGAPVAFKTAAFELVKLDSFWLSATPAVPASRYGEDQSKCPRITTAVFLKHHDADTPFWFLNTHLDHKGSTARLLGSMQLLQYLSSGHTPAVITGDFNARPDSPEIRAITQNEFLGFSDLTENIVGTFHAYKEKPESEMQKIDYIFSDLEGAKSESYSVVDIPKEGVYISDHRPVVSFVTLK